MSFLDKKIDLTLGGYKPLYQAVSEKKDVSVFGLTELSDRTLISSYFLKSFVYVCADYVSASKAYEQFKSIFFDRAIFVRAKDDVLGLYKARSEESAQLRLASLNAACRAVDPIIITTAEALTQLYPQREAFKSATITLKKGEDYDIDKLAQELIFSGYSRANQAFSRGQFSKRGDILDVFSIGDELGTRFEFFGDTLEEIKSYDPSEQTALGKRESATICPNTEVFCKVDEALAKIESLKKHNHKDFEAGEKLLSYLTDAELKLPHVDSCFLPLLPHSTFFEFFDVNTVIYDDAKAIVDNINIVHTEHQNRYKHLLLKGETLICAANQLIEKSQTFVSNRPSVAFHSLMSANRIFEPKAVFNYKSVKLPLNYNRNLITLCDDVNGWLSSGYKVILFCGNETVKQNLTSLFNENRVGANVGVAGSYDIVSDILPYGGVLHEDKLALIGTYNLTQKHTKTILKRKKGDVFTEPEVGGFVVHNIHGVGFCETIKRLEVGGASRDYFVIKYRGGDTLYVPIENMDSLTKLISAEESPRLSKIGGAEFALAKERVKASVKEMAVELTNLYAARVNKSGHAYSADTVFYDEFCEAFPFDETEDQLLAADEGISDLTQGKIMDRLLCGDVGYGKTEVALRLAFKVILENKQVALICPTTILAKQHFVTVKNRMEQFGVRMASLTRFDSKAQIEKTLKALKAGDIDIVVGTHRVLSRDVEFKDLGLLILDEEQRFGVADKEKIKTIKNSINVLALSATPIPRTLHMSMSGIRDISLLDTPPSMRIPIQTYVTELTDSLIIDACTREINRGGQVFIVYNRVETIEKFAFKVQSLLPDARIAIGHGQMKENMLENTILDFVEGNKDILIATTIIENGIDMPNANTMLVIDSDRFGLSQLYQLRGRVGRSDRLAYVYFTFDENKPLTETAYKRLEAITEYTEFGSGFKIAMRDLEIRGAGNVLGREQHGHMEKVGYDMYCKLLENAVKELSGEQGYNVEQKEVKVLTDFNAFIPISYIQDNDWRMRAYSRISRVCDNSERQKLIKDLEDIYGKLPTSADNLLTVAMIKNLASKLNAITVTLKKAECSITFGKIQDIPQGAVELAGSKLRVLESKIDFRADRTDMIAFLLKAAKY